MRPAALTVLLLASAACAEEGAVPPEERERVLARVAERSASLKDLSADFEQTSVREGLSKPVLSRGTLRYRVDPEAGGEALLRIAEPEPTVIRISRGRMETYVPEDRQVEIITLKEGEAGSRAVEATVLLYGRTRAFWESRFEVSVLPKAKDAETDELSLVPRDEALRKTLKEIRMWVAADTALPVRVRYRYARGEEVTMAFGRVKADTGLKPSDVALRYPKDTEVLRPGEDGEER